jgi:hypothetical protein
LINNQSVRGDAMKKILTAFVAVAVVGVAALATAGTADARWGYGWRGGWGWGPGPFVAGAVVAGALAAPYYYGGYGPGYAPGYAYGPGPYGPYPYGYGCRRVWNGYYWVRGC